MNRDQKTVQLSTLIIVAGFMSVIGFIAGTRKDEFLGLFSAVTGSKINNDNLELARVQQTYKALKQRFDGDLDKEKLIDGATKGMVDAAGDKHTVFLDKKQAEEFEKSLSGDVGAGVGIEVGVKNNHPIVVRSLKNNSASQAGIKAGDVILAVNDESVVDNTVEEVANKIRGQAGTTVKLTVKRGDEAKDFSIIRKKIENPSVDLEIDGDTAILKVSRFDSETGNLARKYAQEINNRGISKVILDLRNNGGGYVTAAKALASLWVKRGNTIVVERRGLAVIDELKASGDNLLSGKKTIVLVNERSASASEIVTGALKEYDLAKIYGEKTYGKGSVQETVNLADGALLKVTTAKWYTPKGNNINQAGIHPDKEIKLTTDDVNNDRDPQLDTAKKDL